MNKMKQIQQALRFQKPQLGGIGGSIRGSASQRTVGGLLNSCLDPTLASSTQRISQRASIINFEQATSNNELEATNKISSLALLVDDTQKQKDQQL